jgi:hypothetical protein
MGKGKKKKGNQNASFYKAVKPFIKDNRMLLAILGAMGAGVALASAVGSDKGRTIVDNLTKALTNWGQPLDTPGALTAGTTTASTSLDDKKGKHPKQFAVE